MSPRRVWEYSSSLDRTVDVQGGSRRREGSLGLGEWKSPIVTHVREGWGKPFRRVLTVFNWSLLRQGFLVLYRVVYSWVGVLVSTLGRVGPRKVPVILAVGTVTGHRYTLMVVWFGISRPTEVVSPFSRVRLPDDRTLWDKRQYDSYSIYVSTLLICSITDDKSFENTSTVNNVKYK